MNLTKEMLMQRRNEFLQLAEKASIQQQQALGHVHELNDILAMMNAPEICQEEPKAKPPVRRKAKTAA